MMFSTTVPGEERIAAADVDRFGPQRFERAPGDVFAVEENPARLRLDEPRQQAGQGPGLERIEGDKRR